VDFSFLANGLVVNGEWRSFQKTWFDEYDWLEYSKPKDATYTYIAISSLIRQSLKSLRVW
jgi:hypothetical protein